MVLPIYDGAPFLAQAIESILAQTFRDFELITIDDGSRDASGEILDRFARSDSRVTALYQANAGMIAALNRGLALARGEFIARMDQDDVAHPERFARQVSFLDAHSDVAVVGSAVTLIDETGKRIRDVDYPAIPETVAKFLEIGAPLAHPAVMMRRDAVGAVGGYREAFRYAEDYDLWLRMAERYRMSNLADRLLLYRQHQSKQSSTYAVEQRFATRMALAAAHCRRAGKPDPSDGLSALTLRDIDRFDLSPGERGTLPLELVETLLAADPTMRKPNAVRTALDLLEQADVASTDGARLVRAMMMLAYGFGRRGQPLAAARWLSRAVRCRRNGFADVCAVTFRWAVHRLARRGRPAARKGEGTRLHPMEKRRFVEWLASPGGPGAAPCLRKFRPRAMARFVLALRNTLSGRPSRPRDFRCLHLPSTPFVKVVALRHHAKAFRTRVFVETGTFFGDTTAAVAELFERCYTIELSPELYARAQKRFLGTSHVVCINGESGAELARVLEDIQEPALFWLDAHASGGVTADGGFDPILQELGAIFRHRIKDHVVLVDDARGREEMIMRAVPSNYRVSLRNDIIRIVPA
ncbi:MAG TPA: glycosyltransferase [Candidatus Cybelea sp.]|nr:glycosyltransferase [Candidatus Cybelea sp.]